MNDRALSWKLIAPPDIPENSMQNMRLKNYETGKLSKQIGTWIAGYVLSFSSGL